MFTDRVGCQQLAAAFLAANEWRPFPTASDREAWNKLAEPSFNLARKHWLIGRAELLQDQPWPALPARVYTTFIHTGNRVACEAPYFARREALGNLVLAECFEGQGRFLPDIVDGLWAILEETTWAISAHAARAPGDALPRYTEETPDLFACETAFLLAETDYLLRDSWRTAYPSLSARIRYEILRRIIEPVERDSHLWWTSGHNNWTPWCCSSVFGAALYTVTDVARLGALGERLLAYCDRFVSHYGPDGGCDEGPSYWGVAGGALLLFLELLRDRSQGKIDFYGEPLLTEMGLYLRRVHLDGPWFASFADCRVRMDGLRRAIVYRYGERIGDEGLKNLALLAMTDWRPAGSLAQPFPEHLCAGGLMQNLRELFWIPACARPYAAERELTNWLPNLQVLTARTDPHSDRGLVLAAKGGHNAENHNHNDLGQFIILLDGDPIIIDPGAETYTRQTFSEARYDLWYIRSQGHNVPLINGREQAAGRKFAARDVTFSEAGPLRRLRMDLADAYPPEIALRRLERTLEITAEPTERITVRDRIELDRFDCPPQLNLLTPCQIGLERPGRVVFCGTQLRQLRLEFDPEILNLEVTEQPLTDPWQAEALGSKLTKLSLIARGQRLEYDYQLDFSTD